MGVVFEAYDRDRAQTVALKTLPAFDADALYRFKQEFRTLAGVHHANLVRLYELVASEGGQVFFTMERVHGDDFAQYVRGSTSTRPAKRSEIVTVVDTHIRETSRPGLLTRRSERPPASPLDVDRLRAALRQLVQGVRAIHAAGKVHRDLKPSNVLVTHGGRVVILDFGVAAERFDRDMAAPSGEIVGSPIYMAPEQLLCEGAPAPPADWYSVGVMLYEVLAGRRPFVGSMAEILALKTLKDPPPPSACAEGVPPELDELCMALLQQDPEARPGAEAILSMLGAVVSSAPPPLLALADASSAFIGREGPLQALGDAFAESRAGCPMTVRIAGVGGMGKSTIVHHFLDGVVQRGDALVLRGRAYEREVVPYKAVDGIIDALSRHLLALEESGDPLALPEDAWALARLFPVLRRVPSVAQLVNPKTVDLQGVRARAFTALRALLVSLVRRAPLVLFIDDVQWGDVDSAMLVADLVRPPDAPALLLVMTFRSGEEPPSSFLAELSQRWPEGAEAHEVLVGPLPIEEAEHLARSLLDMSDALGEMTAKAVARESRGSPFLIEELARSNRGLSPTSEAKLNVLTLEQMVGERLERLPEGARGALEMLALDGRPMRVSLLAQASGLTPIDEVVTLLAARRFARTGQRDGEDIVESIHDRIRATVAAQIPEGRRRAFHARLADVLEEASSGDAEAIAVHWLGAGEGARAAAWASTAAEQATRKFAFDRAARLLELALANTPEAKTSPEVRQLHARLANALQFAGRYEASAREYLAAADGAPTDQVIALHRAAAEQLLMGGRMDEGAELLHRVLYALDMRAPRSAFAAVFWLLLHRAWLAMRGLGFSTRAPEEVQPEDRVRIDALFAVAMGFSIVDVVLGACMQTRQLIEALRKGDELQIVRAASIEAGHMAATGTREVRGSVRSLRLRERSPNGMRSRNGSCTPRGRAGSASGIAAAGRRRDRCSIAPYRSVSKASRASRASVSSMSTLLITWGNSASAVGSCVVSKPKPRTDGSSSPRSTCTRARASGCCSSRIGRSSRGARRATRSLSGRIRAFRFSTGKTWSGRPRSICTKGMAKRPTRAFAAVSARSAAACCSRRGTSGRSRAIPSDVLRSRRSPRVPSRGARGSPRRAGWRSASRVSRTLGRGHWRRCSARWRRTPRATGPGRPGPCATGSRARRRQARFCMPCQRAIVSASS
jgi:tetratricopeptide (TPR) repeat protein